MPGIVTRHQELNSSPSRDEILALMARGAGRRQANTEITNCRESKDLKKARAETEYKTRDLL